MLSKKTPKKLFLIIFSIVLLSVFVAGCTSDSSSDPDNFTDYNNSDLTSLNDNNDSSTQGQNTTKKSVSKGKTPHYEKKGYCDYVVDGDTINVVGVGRIRLVGVNTPERGEPGYQEAKDFVESYCMGKTVYLDVDDEENYDKYGRTLAVVYVGNKNLNALLLQKGYAEVMYIPPSEFNPYSWT